MIHFPLWTGTPTPCKTRTFRLVVPGTVARHGAEIREGRFHNIATRTERNAAGKFNTRWENDAAAYNLISTRTVR